MKIGMVAPPPGTASMVVAASLSRNLARRGHEVHFIGNRAGTPYLAEEGVSEHVIDASMGAVTDPPMHDLALAAKIASVAEEAKLELIHVHAAIPHAIAAALACRIVSGKAPKLVTTLHGVERSVPSGPRASRPRQFRRGDLRLRLIEACRGRRARSEDDSRHP